MCPCGCVTTCNESYEITYNLRNQSYQWKVKLVQRNLGIRILMGGTLSKSSYSLIDVLTPISLLLLLNYTNLSLKNSPCLCDYVLKVILSNMQSILIYIVIRSIVGKTLNIKVFLVTCGKFKYVVIRSTYS